MSMIDPASYILEFKNEPYEKLILERDKLIRKIKYFEKHKNKLMKNNNFSVFPSPDTHYWWNLKTLSVLCKMMSEIISNEDE